MMHADVGCVGQVVDFWAFSTEQWGKEIMSMHHTRNALQKSTPQVIFPCQRALPIGAHILHEEQDEAALAMQKLSDACSAGNEMLSLFRRPT